MTANKLMYSLAAALIVGGALGGLVVHGCSRTAEPVVRVEVHRDTLIRRDTIAAVARAEIRTIVETDTVLRTDDALAGTLLRTIDSLLFTIDSLSDLVASAETVTPEYRLHQEYSYRQREFRHDLTIHRSDTVRTVEPARETLFEKIQRYGFWVAIAALIGVAIAQ